MQKTAIIATASLVALASHVWMVAALWQAGLPMGAAVYVALPFIVGLTVWKRGKHA